jgi:hypothetical protein
MKDIQAIAMAVLSTSPTARLSQLMLLALAVYFYSSTALWAQTSDSPPGEAADSWMATTESHSGNLNPTRTIEGHTQSGNRTLDKQSLQRRGADGQFEPYQDIEKETVQLDATSVRTTTRTFGRDANGAKTLAQVTEEAKHTLLGGDSKVLRITFNPDVNGKLQPVQREIVEAETISKGVEETDTTVMLPNINGGLAPAFKTHELRKRRADGTTESQKTTLLADGAGKWELSETRQVTTSQEGPNRTVEERIFRPDAEGQLVEVSRAVTQESESASGEKRSSVETFSIDVPGTTRDGSLHLVERKTSTQRSSFSGERTTEQKVEQTNPGDPGAGLRVSVLVDGRIVPGPSGEESTVTIRARDANGSFGIVSVDTTKSDRIPTIQIQQTPSE